VAVFHGHYEHPGALLRSACGGDSEYHEIAAAPFGRPARAPNPPGYTLRCRHANDWQKQESDMNMKSTSRPENGAASANITRRIKELGDWRGETLAEVRRLIHAADPDIAEEWKWRGVPVWSHDGIVCTGESYKQVIKLTFARGASIKDPKKLFNSSLEGNTRRAIDLREGEKINEAAFKALIRAAVAANAAALAQRAAKKTKK
jgi:hypothetical protein